MRIPANFCELMAAYFKAPKGRNSIAQGNALGSEREIVSPCRGDTAGGVTPFQGFDLSLAVSQGVALGCLLFAPLGLAFPNLCPPGTAPEKL
ncbi:MAG: hypothetical protein RLZZ15_4396 [Verrucomicrobiota bacterium]|jgi:hypothetical protein